MDFLASLGVWPGSCAHRTRRASTCKYWLSRCRVRGGTAHGDAHSKWNVELGAVKSSAQSALVLNVLRLGDGGTNTWAAVPSHHSGGHPRPPGSQQMAATSTRENTSARPIGQLEVKDELGQRIGLSGER